MKKIYFLAFVLTSLIFACSPEDPGIIEEKPEPKDTIDDSPETIDTIAPTHFTQKALLEYFSGAWCGYCPEGKDFAEDLKNNSPEGVFDYVVYHFNDKMDVGYDNAINNKFQSGYPTGMINRTGAKAENRGNWQGRVNTVLSNEGKCGLAIDATSSDDSKHYVKVNLAIGEEDLPEGNYFITVLLVEEEMSGTGLGWDQVNYFHTTAGHPYQGKGNPILGYIHTNVVRYVFNKTEPLGQPIDAASLKAGTITSFDFNIFNVIMGEAEDLHVIAFLHEYSENSSSYVHNMQKVKMGSLKNYD